MFKVIAMQGDFPLPHQPHWAVEFETEEAANSAALETFQKLLQAEACPGDELIVFIHNAEDDEICDNPTGVVVAGLLFKRA